MEDKEGLSVQTHLSGASIPFDKGCFPILILGGQGGTVQRKCTPCFQADGMGRKLCCWLLFLSCSQFKITLVPKWHIWGWPILIPFSVSLKTRARLGRREPDSSRLIALLPLGRASSSLSRWLLTLQPQCLHSGWRGEGRTTSSVSFSQDGNQARSSKSPPPISVEPRGVVHWIPLAKWEVSHISTLWLKFSGSNKIRFHTLFPPNHLCQRLNRNTAWYSNKVTSGMKNGKLYAIKLQNQSKIGRRTPKEP